MPISISSISIELLTQPMLKNSTDISLSDKGVPLGILCHLANAENNSPFQEWLGFLVTKSIHHKINTRLQGFSPQIFSIYVKKRVNGICSYDLTTTCINEALY